nr:biotin transporter BioY [uncultured Merdimonas sp.]
MYQSRTTISDFCFIAIMAAVTAVMAQISVPMPMGVPMTMQTFAVTLAAIILGSKRGALAMLIYLLIGAVGVPVFSNFTGGIPSFVGPTGGFLVSFPIMAYLIGLGVELKSKYLFILFLILGTISNYVVGVLFYMVITDSSVLAATAACVIPFLPTAVLKAVLASVFGIQVKKRIHLALQGAGKQ